MKYILVLVFFWSLALQAQPKLYALLLADTQNRQTGKAHRQNLEHIQREVAQIAQHTQLRPSVFVLDSVNFSRNALDNLLSNLSCQKNDVIFFYYSGSEYVGKAKGNDAKLWFKDDIFPLDELKANLDSLHPRLSVIITDLCNQNDEQTNANFSQQKANKENYMALFMKSSGKIVMSNHAARDQAELKTAQNGSIFTAGIIDAIRQIPDSTATNAWEDLYKKSRYYTIIESRGSQNPQSQQQVSAYHYVEEKPKVEKPDKVKINKELAIQPNKPKENPKTKENHVFVKNTPSVISLSSQSKANLDAIQENISKIVDGTNKNMPKGKLQESILRIFGESIAQLKITDGTVLKKSQEFLGISSEKSPYQTTQIRWFKPAELIQWTADEKGNYQLVFKIVQQYRHLDKNQELKYSYLSEKKLNFLLHNPSGQEQDWRLELVSVEKK